MHKLDFKNYLQLITIALMIFLVSFRGDTRDTFSYVEVYRGLQDFPWSPIEFWNKYSMEWGFGILVGIIKKIGLPVEFQFFAVSLLTFFAISRAAVNFGMSPWSPIPFYLCTFFWVHQLMQIRQGFAISFAFWAISIIIRKSQLGISSALVVIVGVLFHIVSIIPVVVGILLSWFAPRVKAVSNIFWAISIFGTFFAICRYLVTSDLLFLTSRISNYVDSEMYAATRSILEPANLRAIFLTIAFFIWRPSADRPWFKCYLILFGIYVAHLGIRLGFLDFAILSGRIGSALGFAEIFLIPMLIKDRFQNAFLRLVLVCAYFLLHLAIAFLVLVPFLPEDYFRPLP
jgi:hypothetical protein